MVSRLRQFRSPRAEWRDHRNIREHHWEVQSQYFVRWQRSEPTLLHFEDAEGGKTEDFGPFGALTCVDGVMRVDGDELFAKFIEQTQPWHCFRTDNYWPAIVIKPAP